MLSICAIATGAMAVAAQTVPPQVVPQAWWSGPSVERPGRQEFTGRLLVKMRADALGNADAQGSLAAFAPRVIDGLNETIISVPPGLSEDALAASLLSTGKFEWVRPDWLLFPTATGVIPDDPWFGEQWNLDRIEAPHAWRISQGSPAVTVAIIDTGADFLHPDLAANMVLGYCSYILTRHAQTTQPPWNSIVMDVNGHGTAIAGVVGAIGNNELAMAGVGWRLSLMPVRASGVPSGAASFGDIQNGALWAANNGARVISVSYTGVEDPGINTLGQNLRNRGALLVWAMDDDGVNTDTTFPFDHPSVTVVSGTSTRDERWISNQSPGQGSSYGTGVDIAAPAEQVPVTTIGGGVIVAEGNSFAAPTVAGALAMVWSVAPGMSPGEVERAVLNSADDIGPPGEDIEFGAGRLNLNRAMWGAVVHEFARGRATGQINQRAFGAENLYDFAARPFVITGEGPEADAAAVSGFLRRAERKDLTHGRR